MPRPSKTVFDSPIAGKWYTDNPMQLRTELTAYLQQAEPRATPTPPVLGLIVPHAGYRYSGKVAASAYRFIQGQKIKRFVILATSHRVGFTGAALINGTHWRTPLGEQGIDHEAVSWLSKQPLFALREDAFSQEHSLDIQVPFIQIIAPDSLLVPVVVGQLNPIQAEDIGRSLRTLLDGETVLIASSDFTHYGPSFGFIPFRDNIPGNLKALADKAFYHIGAQDVAGLQEYRRTSGDTICGIAPISALLAALPRSVDAHPLHFDTSGGITGDYTNSVSYFSIAFVAAPSRSPFRGVDILDAREQTFLLNTARQTLKDHLSGKKTEKAPSKTYSDKLREPLGVFVTLKKNGNLRGCIGSIVATESLLKGVIRNTINAASHDPRFTPLTPSEESQVEIEISVLTALQKVQDVDDIAIGRDGILLEHRGRRSVFLPQVAPEQGWDLETTLNHLAMKAGLSKDAWRQNTTFQTFQAQVFQESQHHTPNP